MDTIKQVEMKEKILKDYFRRTRKQLKTKLYSRNLIKGINTWTVPFVRYSESLLKLTREELQQMDKRIRKLMSVNKAIYPKYNIDRLNETRKERGRGPASIEDSIDTSIRQLQDYIKKYKEKLIRVTRNNINNTSINRTKHKH